MNGKDRKKKCVNKKNVLWFKSFKLLMVYVVCNWHFISFYLHFIRIDQRPSFEFLNVQFMNSFDALLFLSSQFFVRQNKRRARSKRFNIQILRLFLNKKNTHRKSTISFEFPFAFWMNKNGIDWIPFVSYIIDDANF